MPHKTAEARREYKRAYRAAHPIEWRYTDLKARAKHRGIRFAITLAEFTQLCHETGYHLDTGNSAEKKTLDRKIEDYNIGYTYANITIKTRSENTRKENNRRVKPWYGLEEMSPFTTEHPFKVA